MNSRFVLVMRVWSLLVPLLVGAQATNAQPTSSLTRKTGEASEPFSHVVAVHELADGRALVADVKERTLSIVDFTGGAVRQLGRSGNGPNEYTSVQPLVRGRGDTLFVLDFPARRALRIAPTGTLAGTAPIDITIADTLPGERHVGDRIVSGPRYTDATGGLFYEVKYIEQGKGVQPDFLVARWDPVSRASKAIASMRAWYPEKSSRWRAPFMYQDVWVAAPDGRVARVVPTDYHVEWYRDGVLIARGAPISSAPVRVVREDRDAWYAARAGHGPGRATLTGPPQPAGAESRRVTVPRPPGFTDADFPNVKPPFVEEFVGRAAQLTPEGELWVMRAGAFGATAATADVFDGSGRLVRRVSFPATHRVAGFGTGVVYLVRTDDDGLQWLERYAR